MHTPTLPEVVLLAEHLDGAAWREYAPGVVAVPVAPAPEGEDEVQPRGGVADAAALYGIDLMHEAERQDVKGQAGQTAVVHLPRVLPGVAQVPWAGLPPAVVLLGIGDGGPAALRRAGLALGRAAAGTGTAVTTVGAGPAPEALRAFVEGFSLAAFRMPRSGRTDAPGKPPAERLVLLGAAGAEAEAAVAAACAGVRATWLTRLLAATPSNTKNPAWLAERAAELAAAAPQAGGSLEVAVHDEEWLRRQGMEGILAVGGGSVTPPRLVTVAWTPARTAATTRTVVLVGKGITFDTGGISLKPREAMIPMKTDMAGSATVLTTVLAAAELGLPHRVVAVLALAENAMGGASYRPGDVVRVYDGTTVEVSNTDAEGRMVLADGLGWARATLRPDVLIDVATLTGAATLGLGRGHAALYATDEDLAAALVGAGEAAGEHAWRMPLVGDYRPALESEVADIAHASADPHVGAGSITAALFLRHFVGDTPWAHLDIAGAGRTGGKHHELPAAAPTGYGARLLLRYLEGLG
ncbi:leucyl aminopeptidase family protein [Georgenia sp. AZ-5]|uniref:leucyl aminopeptidase family protein n=1 Tax=Georgenia sp. AZ-5 TaxID=3367526 RepID=UPI003754FE6D